MDFAERQARRTSLPKPDGADRQPRRQEDPPVRDAPSRVTPAVDLSDGVTMSSDGLYHAGGYAFTTEAQARSFVARRRTGVPGLQPAGRVEEARPTYRPSSSSVPPPPSPPSPPPPPRAVPPVSTRRTPAGVEPRWILGPETWEVGSVTFEARLLYVGNQHHPYAYPRHPSLIDPALPVADSYSASDAVMTWNIDYSAFEPAVRRGYLEWLAGGRTGGASPAFAKLYFQGLERRLLFEDARADAPLILAELRRLMPFYGDDYNFGPAATKLIDLASVISKEEGPPTRPSLSLRNGFELPLKLRIELGERVAAGDALDADAALCWLLATPDTWPRTPVTRCFDEFLDLWRRRFRQSYATGLKIRVPKARIDYRYQSATGFHVDLRLADVPDLSGTTAPIVRLHEMMNACSDELGSYSRMVGSDAAARGTIAAAALLPRDMVDGPFGKPLRVARTRLDLTSGAPTLTTADAVMEIVGLAPVGANGTIGSPSQKQIAQRLDAMAVGFEPDRRHGATGAMTGGSAVGLFEIGDATQGAGDDPAYAIARSVVDVAILAASSDGSIVQSELLTIGEHVVGLTELGDHARRRLAAHVAVVAKQPPKVSAALKRLADMPADAKRAVAAAAAATILADGQILPAEVRFLENLYKVLGLPADDVYGVLHRGGEPDAPVSVMPARAEAGVALPPREPGADLGIDVARLARIRSETSDVSKLLASIFVEEEVAEPAKSQTVAVGRYPGLDTAHAALLSGIVDGSVASRAQFDAAARAARLGAEGAIETLNEWGFDQFDEPVLDDGETLVIPSHILTLLQPMDAS